MFCFILEFDTLKKFKLKNKNAEKNRMKLRKKIIFFDICAILDEIQIKFFMLSCVFSDSNNLNIITELYIIRSIELIIIFLFLFHKLSFSEKL